MKDRFLDFISKNNLISREDNVLVAVSGGVDSVVLCHLLHENDFKFAIAHCNFKLRGLESDNDEIFVENLAKTYGVEHFVMSFDTNKYANEHGISTQMAARDLRYAWFDEIMSNNDYNKLVTAHHLNDSLETALFNFVKGTGIAGLRGIKPVQGKVIRPLLFATKEHVLDYAIQHNLEWREDNSNKSIKYHRNYLRNKVIPALKDVNPKIEESFSLTSYRLSSLENLLLSELKRFNELVRKDGQDVIVDRVRVLEYEAVVIEAFLKQYGFNISQVIKLFELLENENGAIGKILMSDTFQLNIDRGKVIISPKEDNEQLTYNIDNAGQLNLPIGLIKFSATENLQIGNKTDDVKLDYGQLKFPLQVRLWKQGDYFYPLGMKGKKKLSDFMIDQKIPLNLKERVFVLTSEDNIAWVIGHRIDDRYKISDKTQRAFHIQLTK